ncbi:type 1 fimbrial protein [Pseudomonas zeae]|uniref:fimbrial protein n=1 Tax=Pseudomonas TaxID=286 RepID=UPI002148E2D2|nr:fimbrial protein [Pseudomonas zeae]UUT09980.1 type 1 fimbrial protein [Pseudomonas zeae]
MLMRTVYLSFWFVVIVWFPSTASAEDNLYFSGTLVNEPCVLAMEDELLELDFKNVIEKELYLNGRTRGRPITLHLQNCQLGTGKSKVKLSFNGPESTETPGLLMIQSADVHGLLVGLETPGGKPLVLNKIHDMGALIKGDNLISFNAYLQGETKAMQNKSIGLGVFYSIMSFTVSYE